MVGHDIKEEQEEQGEYVRNKLGTKEE